MDITSILRPAAATIAAVLAALVPVSSASAAPAPGRGTTVSVTPLGHLSAAELLARSPFDTNRARYGVDAYRLLYRTVDARGRPTTASGLVVLPDGGPRRLPTVVYEHGTQVSRDGVASVDDESVERVAVQLFASAGFAAVAPDYVGLGTGPGAHPYMDVATEVTASVDLLRAADSFAASRHRPPDHSLRITGFSQGGQAAMGLAQAVQRGAAPLWRLVRVAPVSGPYDVQHSELPALVDHPGEGPGEIDPISGEVYVAYWTIAMNRLHHIYDSPSEVFQAPYDTVVERLFDGDTNDADIVAALPGSPARLLTPQYLQRLRHPAGGLLAALRENDDTCRWRPRVPVRLFASTGDRDVPIANARVCQADLHRHGADVTITDVGDADHSGSVFRSVPLVLDWFLS
jgi:hypothetical protein